LGVVRLSTVCPKILISTGATMISEMRDGEYMGGVSKGVGDEGEDEREGESEGDSDDPRESLSAGGGRAMRVSSRP
jgi:hypothetical protein